MSCHFALAGRRHTSEIIGPFEVHLTVAESDRPDLLRELADGRGWKLLRIELARGLTPIQPMITFRCQSSMAEAIRAADLAEQTLREAGLHPVRRKLEADATSAGVPQRDDEPHEPGRYFEHHVKVVQLANEAIQTLVAIAEPRGAHVSRNALKLRDDGRVERFVTLRAFDVGWPTARDRLDSLLADLRTAGQVWVSVESEYVVSDTRLDLDEGWLEGA